MEVITLAVSFLEGWRSSKILLAVYVSTPLIVLVMLQAAPMLSCVKLPRWAVPVVWVLELLGLGIFAISAFTVLGVAWGVVAITVFIALLLNGYWSGRHIGTKTDSKANRE